MTREDWFGLFLFGTGVEVGKNWKEKKDGFEYLSRESDPDRFETLPNEED